MFVPAGATWLPWSVVMSAKPRPHENAHSPRITLSGCATVPWQWLGLCHEARCGSWADRRSLCQRDFGHRCGRDARAPGAFPHQDMWDTDTGGCTTDLWQANANWERGRLARMDVRRFGKRTRCRPARPAPCFTAQARHRHQRTVVHPTPGWIDWGDGFWGRIGATRWGQHGAVGGDWFSSLGLRRERGGGRAGLRLGKLRAWRVLRSSAEVFAAQEVGAWRRGGRPAATVDRADRQSGGFLQDLPKNGDYLSVGRAIGRK